MSAEGRKKSKTLRAVRLLVAILGIPLAGWLGLDAWARLRSASVTQEWTAAGRDLHDATEEVLLAEQNAEASRLDADAAAVGMHVWSVRPEKDEEKRMKAMRSRASAYLDELLYGGAEERAAPPEELRAWRADTEPRWARLEENLLTGALPAWRVQRDPPTVLDEPHVLALFSLQVTLLARAFVAEHEGRDVDALRSFEAAWRIAQAMAHRPELISILMETAMLQRSVWAARHLRAVPADMVARLDALDPHRRVAGALAYQTSKERLQFAEPLRAATAVYSADLSDKLGMIVLGPVVRHAVVSRSKQALTLAKTIDAQSPCPVDFPALVAQLEADTLIPGVWRLSEAWVEAARRAEDLRLQGELTRHVLTLREQEIGDELDGFRELDGDCGRAVWRVGVDRAADRLSVEYQERERPTERGINAPLRHSEPLSH